MKKVYYVALLLFLVLSLLFLLSLLRSYFFQERVLEAIYIRADGSVDPDSGPIVSTDNVNYAFTDSVIYPAYEGLVVERSNIVIDGKGYTIQGNHTDKSGTTGILLSGVENVTVRNVEIIDFEIGVWFLDRSNYSLITGNEITGNSWGVYVWESSFSRIVENNITENSEYGIISAYSKHNLILGNKITSNGGYGISLITDDSNNTIAENKITRNTLGGIELVYSSNNSIVENSITDNQDCIILDFISGNNTFFHNNFVDDALQVYVSADSENNLWDNGFEGNYWSSYNGTDSDFDGIGDTPYIIDANNTDSYPLMTPY